MLAACKQYLVGALVVIGLLAAYRVVQSYRHFAWVNITSDKGVQVAIPGWVK